ncbi:hypothetical protein OROHE_022086 [Orobanche hederae]
MQAFNVAQAIDLMANRAQLVEPGFADHTFLTIGINEVIGNNFDIDLPRFSWADPHLFAENENPMPVAIEQSGGLIQLLSTEEIPERGVCLEYLLKRFDHFTSQDRTFTRFLSAMHYQGFPIRQDFGEGFDFAALDQTLPELTSSVIFWNIPRYYVHWCKAFGHGDFPDDEVAFQNSLKDSILYHGGVLAEFELKLGFTETGNGGGSATVVDVVGGGSRSKKGKKGASKKRKRGASKKRKGDESGFRDLGHAIFIAGWETLEDGLHFDYLNTYGPTWGLPPYVGFVGETRGYGRIKSSDLEHVYVPQIMKEGAVGGNP